MSKKQAAKRHVQLGHQYRFYDDPDAFFIPNKERKYYLTWGEKPHPDYPTVFLRVGAEDMRTMCKKVAAPNDHIFFCKYLQLRRFAQDAEKIVRMEPAQKAAFDKFAYEDYCNFIQENPFYYCYCIRRLPVILSWIHGADYIGGPAECANPIHQLQFVGLAGFKRRGARTAVLEFSSDCKDLLESATRAASSRDWDYEQMEQQILSILIWRPFLYCEELLQIMRDVFAFPGSDREFYRLLYWRLRMGKKIYSGKIVTSQDDISFCAYDSRVYEELVPMLSKHPGRLVIPNNVYGMQSMASAGGVRGYVPEYKALCAYILQNGGFHNEMRSSETEMEYFERDMVYDMLHGDHAKLLYNEACREMPTKELDLAQQLILYRLSVLIALKTPLVISPYGIRLTYVTDAFKIIEAEELPAKLFPIHVKKGKSSVGLTNLLCLDSKQQADLMLLDQLPAELAEKTAQQLVEYSEQPLPYQVLLAAQLSVIGSPLYDTVFQAILKEHPEALQTVQACIDAIAQEREIRLELTGSYVFRIM